MKEIKLTINKREFVCSFGLGFLGECLENLDLSVFEIGEKLDKNPFKWIPTLIYESIKYTEDVDFTKKDLVNWLEEDNNGTKTMNSFLIAFIDSLKKDVPKQEGVKKKKPSVKK